MQGGNMKIITIFDLDGTLIPVNDRLKYLDEKPVDYKKFYESSLDYEPIKSTYNIIKVFNELIKQRDDNFIYLLTARNIKYKETTIEWLKKYNIPYDKLIMRDKNLSDVDFKEMIIDDILKEDFINFIFEDREHIIKVLEKKGLEIIKVEE